MPIPSRLAPSRKRIRATNTDEDEADERETRGSGDGWKRKRGEREGTVVWVPGSDGACGSRNRSVEPVLGPVFRAVYARWIVDNGRKSCPPTLPLVSFFPPWRGARNNPQTRLEFDLP